MISHPTRRTLLTGGGALFAAAMIPKVASAASARDPRLIVMVLRGALDGLAAVGPIGDPDYAALHGPLAMRLDGPTPALPLDGFFALNPGMPNLARMLREKQATIVHATTTGYRERSHFDGQDVLESGMPAPGFTDSGWLNRAVALLPAGGRVGHGGALAVGAATPTILRGAAPVMGWEPATIPAASDELARRVLDLYAHTDPALASAMRQGLDVDRISMNGAAAMNGALMSGSPMNATPVSTASTSGASMNGAPMNGAPMARDAAGGGKRRSGVLASAEGAARLLAADDGPRVAALVLDGWDTHAAEGGATGRLMQLLAGLDGAFATFETGLGPAWKNTVIVAITEFGRTVHVNGTVGTDHGTGTVAFLAGGAVAGGRVVADWPGLKPAQLYEARDLMPTTDLRAVLKGVLADHLGLPAAALGTGVFPGTLAIRPMAGLIA